MMGSKMKWIIVFFITLFSFNLLADKKDSVYLKIKKGEESPFSGVLMNEATAIKVGKIRIEFKSLENKVKINTDLWEFKENEYKEALKKADKKIEKLSQKSWWNQNKLWVGVVVGFIASSVATYGAYKLATLNR